MAIAGGTDWTKWLPLVAVLALAACAPVPENPSTFLLKADPPDVPAASERLLDELVVGLNQVNLPTGYPSRGSVVTVDDPEDPSASQSTCQAGGAEASGDGCIALSASGDYLRIQPVTWQSEVFHPYRIYVVPDELFVAFDPVQNYVAVDVIVMPDSIGWDQVQTAVELAAEALGAKPIAP